MMQANLQVGRCGLTEGHTSHESSASLTEAKRHLGAAGGTGIGNIKPSSVNVVLTLTCEIRNTWQGVSHYVPR